MARLSDLGTVRIGEESVPLRTVVQGYASVWLGSAMDADGAPVNLPSAPAVRVEFATCTLTTSRARGDTAATVGSIELMDIPPARDLAVVLLDQATLPGRFSVTVPADIYPPEIEPDVSTGVPIAIGYVTMTRGGWVRVARFLLAFRRGAPA